MAKEKKTRKEKEVPFSYYILNIKLISDSRSGESAYRRIMEDLYNNSVIKPIGKGKKAFIRFMKPYEFDGQTFFWGKILKFTDLENRNDWINVITKENESIDIPPNTFPDPQETEFVFVPQAHRLALKMSTEFSLSNANIFFKLAIGDVLDLNEDFSVTIQQSRDIYEVIYNAYSVEKLSIKLTYTNSDNISDDVAAWMDSQYRMSNSSEGDLSFKAAKQESLNMDTPIIQGGLELARENGEAEAKIKDAQGNRTVQTIDHPEKIKSKASSEDAIKFSMFEEIFRRYRGIL